MAIAAIIFTESPYAENPPLGASHPSLHGRRPPECAIPSHRAQRRRCDHSIGHIVVDRADEPGRRRTESPKHAIKLCGGTNFRRSVSARSEEGPRKHLYNARLTGLRRIEWPDPDLG